MPVPVGVIVERRLIERLLRAEALGPATAQPLSDLRWVERRRLGRLQDAGVVREGTPGRYYLDGPALADHLSRRRRRLLIAIVLVVAAAVVVLLLSRQQ